MAGCSYRALPGNEKRHQCEGGHLDHVGHTGRQAQSCEAGNLPPVGLFHAGPDPVRPVNRVAAQEQHRHQQQEIVDYQRGPCATHSTLGRQACTAGNKPDRQRNFHNQRADLQPGDQHRFAQGLVERAELPEQKRGRKGQGQHCQISAHLCLHVWRYVGPLQQAAGQQQHGHAGTTQQRAQVKALADGPAQRVMLLGAAHLRPDGQKRLNHADQSDINTDVDGRADRQRSQRRVTVAPRNHGVCHPEGHHCQLPQQHGAGMAQDELEFFHAPGIRRRNTTTFSLRSMGRRTMIKRCHSFSGCVCFIAAREPLSTTM